MDRVRITDDLSFSRIVYGMWRLGDDEDRSPKHVRAKIDACLEQGITTMDQADIYGGYTAEGLFGAALTPELRDRIEIITKCGIVAPSERYDVSVKHYDTSRRHIAACIDRSLSDMGIEHIDLMLIHRSDPFMDPAETGAALDGAVASGKVRAVGVSNFREHDWKLLQSAMSNPLRVNQIELSLRHTDPLTNGDLSFIREVGAVPMAWSPLGGGALMSGKSGHGALRTAIAEYAHARGVEMSGVAVAWLLAHPAGIVPVMGTNNLERIRRIAEATDIRMSREEWFELYTHALGHEVP